MAGTAVDGVVGAGSNLRGVSKRTRRKKPGRPAARKQVRRTPPQRRAGRDEPDLMGNVATALADE
ncbi:MAG: hypothetical protein ACRDTF_19050, partial [Pseudonocardiaceae bacterium]